MVKISICDDEIKILIEIKEMLEKLYEEIEITIYQDYKELLLDVEKEEYEIDLLILDIQMGENGIDISKKIVKNKLDVLLIFMSGYAQFYEDIFQVQPIYFLKKPISEERVKKAVDKAIELINNRKRIFSFESNGMLMKFESHDIYYIESLGRKLYFYGKQKNAPVYLKLSYLEERVPNNFVRIHQSYIINIDYLKKFSQKGAILKTGEVIPVSQKRYKGARIKIFEYVQKESLIE